MGNLLLWYLAFVPIAGVVAQWAAWRLRIPSILLLLGGGMILGRFINPDDLLANLLSGDPASAPRLLFPLASISVAIILFEGGLSLELNELKKGAKPVWRLVTIGALLAWGMGAVAAHFCLGLDWRLAALLGAILVVTGPTVVGPMLRTIRPQANVAAIIKWEGIVIDPIGALLAVLVFEQVFPLHGAANWQDAAWVLLKTIVVGGAAGILATIFLVEALRRYWVPDFLHEVLVLGVVLGSFVISNALQKESGLVTVTILGFVLANQRLVRVHHVVHFKENLRTLLISCLFIVLGSRVNPEDFVKLGWGGLAFLGALILLVRPISVILATMFSGLKWNERIFLSLVAPRGIVAAAVTSIFALEALASVHANQHLEHLAGQINQLPTIAFLVIVGTVAFYGLFAPLAAKWLKLSDADAQGVLIVGAEPWVLQLALVLREAGMRVLLVDSNFRRIAEARLAGLEAVCGSILAEDLFHHVDLAGLGRLFALTPNDEVNTLATREFLPIFGRENTYQLPLWTGHSGVREAIGKHLQARTLFGKEWTADEFDLRFDNHAKWKTTRLTAEFTFADYVREYGARATVLFVLDAKGHLLVQTVGKTLEPKAGQSVIAVLVEPAPRV